MDIFINRASSTADKKQEKPQPQSRGKRKERRKKERRKTLNDGLIVSLSTTDDRRIKRDRRQEQESMVFHLPKKDEEPEVKKFSAIA